MAEDSLEDVTMVASLTVMKREDVGPVVSRCTGGAK